MVRSSPRRPLPECSTTLYKSCPTSRLERRSILARSSRWARLATAALLNMGGRSIQAISSSLKSRGSAVCKIVLYGGGDNAFCRSFNTAYGGRHQRSEEHTSELQSLMRISYAVFCLKKKT